MVGGFIKGGGAEIWTKYFRNGLSRLLPFGQWGHSFVAKFYFLLCRKFFPSVSEIAPSSLSSLELTIRLKYTNTILCQFEWFSRGTRMKCIENRLKQDQYYLGLTASALY